MMRLQKSSRAAFSPLLRNFQPIPVQHAAKMAPFHRHTLTAGYDVPLADKPVVRRAGRKKIVIKLVAVTACISGVAHTYMAAERLEKLCAQEKWRVKVETQGALRVENKLSPADIAQADVVLLITDIMLGDGERFVGHRGVQVSVHRFLSESEKVLSAVRKAVTSPQSTLIRLE